MDFRFSDVSLGSDFCSFLRKSHLYLNLVGKQGGPIMAAMEKKNMSTSHGTLKEQLWGRGCFSLLFSLSFPTSLLFYTEDAAWIGCWTRDYSAKTYGIFKINNENILNHVYNFLRYGAKIVRQKNCPILQSHEIQDAKC